MTINRNTIKRQIAAARRLITLMSTRALRPANAATDESQLQDAFDQLDQATSALAWEFYQHQPEEQDGIRQ